ncbi:MAG: acyl-CoA/acyl-ACP dehydrogenase [Acidimicrobiia bacterium]|nr:acyl-CoA/acyl-ACP dehydrogenase [Acidimicrobiia bacterium]
MDFSFSEEQVALGELAEQIFAGQVDADRVAEVEASADRFDRELWAELAKANLLGVAIAEQYGGLGFDVVETLQVLQQQGRRVAQVPLLATLVAGAMPMGHFGSDAQQQRWLPGVVAGEVVLTSAFSETGSNDPHHSSVVARVSTDGWTLEGTKIAVPAAGVAQAVLVPAATDAGLTVFIVDLDRAGLTVELNDTTNHELHGTLTFADVVVTDADVLGEVDRGTAVVDWAVQRIQLGTSAIVLGACEEALRMAAEYTSQREQFGRPLSTNQGVALRAADCYIAVEGIRVTLLQAAWRLAAGLPAAWQTEVAKWWSAEVGQQCVHHVQHLHGGMGADIDYPVHRYFLWVKQLENTHGGGSQQLARLGARIAEQAKTAAGS